MYNLSYLSVDAFTGNLLIVGIIFKDAYILAGKVHRLVQSQRYRLVSLRSWELAGPDHGLTLLSSYRYMVCNLRGLAHLHMAPGPAVGLKCRYLELTGISPHGL